MKLLIIVLMISSCSVQKGFDYIIEQIYTEEDPRPFTGVTPELQEYVDRWEEDTGIPVVDIPIAIQDINPGKDITTIFQKCLKIPKPWDEYIKESCSYTGGLCRMKMTPLFNWYAWIQVDTQWWEKNKHNSTAVEQMLYHELGHCLLRLDHNNNVTVDAYGNEWPDSVMHSYLFSEKELMYYELQKEIIYIPELIGE